jgi:hypothetical protein
LAILPNGSAITPLSAKEILMRLSLLIACTIFLSCDILNNNAGADRFCLKFINDGTYDITALFLKPVSDTASWGQSILPVVKLKRLEYFFSGRFESGMEYAFKTAFDSAGTTAYRSFSAMSTAGAPDTITAHAGLSTSSYGLGYNWGMQFQDGEVNVTP